MKLKILTPLGKIKFKNKNIKFKNMKELKEYLQELQDEGIIHKDVNKHIMFLVNKLLTK
jgi:DNA-binding HxlR family transcriptional regulator